MSKITDVAVDLGPRMIMVGVEVLGTADNISVTVAESTEEELEKLKSANEIRLVKMLGESGAGTDHPKEKHTIRLITPDDSEDVVEIDKELWDRFCARARELGVSENELFIIAMDAFLKSQCY